MRLCMMISDFSSISVMRCQSDICCLSSKLDVNSDSKSENWELIISRTALPDLLSFLLFCNPPATQC